MRKSAIVIGFGAFFLTMALLLKFYAYDKLAVVPLDQNTGQTLADPNAKYFDAPTLTFKQGEIRTVLTVDADKAASEKYGKNAVILDKWQFTGKMQDGKFVTTPPLSATEGHFAIDRNTALPIRGFDSTQDKKPIEYKGYTIKFPFGVEKKDYQYWDTTTADTMTMKYQDTEKINGMEVYKFVGDVPKTVYTKMDVPGSLFGLSKNASGIRADRTYSNHRILWVDPVTGVFMKVSEHQVQTLESPNTPKTSLNVLDTTSVMDDATVKTNTDAYSSKATQLKGLKAAPWILGPLGLLLLLAGLAAAIIAGRRRQNPAPVAAPRGSMRTTRPASSETVPAQSTGSSTNSSTGSSAAGTHTAVATDDDETVERHFDSPGRRWGADRSSDTNSLDDDILGSRSSRRDDQR